MGLPMVDAPGRRSAIACARTTSSPRRSTRRAPPARRSRPRPPTPRAARDFVLLNLPTTEAVEAAVFGDDGVARALAPPQLVVDFSTVEGRQGPRVRRDACARRPAAAGSTRRCRAGRRRRAAGTLTVMAGGDADDIARVAPLMTRPRGALHATWDRRQRPRREDDQPADRRLHARGAGRGAAWWPKPPASTPRAFPSASPAAMPTARCCRGCIRAWSRATSRRRAMRASC